MKKLIGTLSLSVILLSCTPTTQSTSNAQQADFGRLELYQSFKSEHFPGRDITVWLPDKYSTDRKYSVIYMHDGQMLFDKRTSWNKQSWNIDSVAASLQQKGDTRPFIVVGIDNHPEGRLFDYLPRKALDYIHENDTLLAKYDIDRFTADSYLRFIVSELKPFIDKNYSTHADRAHTFIMGSSMGGLISMYALCEYPDVFGGAGCLSTHSPLVITDAPEEIPVWSKAFRDYLDSHLPEVNSHLIYMDCGDRTIDKGYIPLQKQIDSLFMAKGWDCSHFQSQFFPGHAHDENSWEARLHIPLTFLLGE